MENPNTRKKKYFISYTARTENDVQWAKWTEWVLRYKLGFVTRMMEYDSRPGDNFRERTNKALKEADCVIGVLTEGFLQSKECTDEWTNAKHFIPVRFDDCHPGGLLSSHTYIDLTGQDKKAAKEKLMTEIVGVQRPTEEPYYPVFVGNSAEIPKEPYFPVFSTDNLPEREEDPPVPENLEADKERTPKPGSDDNGPNSERSQKKNMPAQSKKSAQRKKKRRILIPLAMILFLTVLVFVVFAVYFWKNPINGPVEPSWAQKQIEEAQLDIAQLPGLNGCWWFEEIPWFIPPVRQLLMEKLDKNPGMLQGLNGSKGNDLAFYDSNVIQAYGKLWEAVDPKSVDSIRINVNDQWQQDLVRELRRMSSKAPLKQDFTEVTRAFMLGRKEDDLSAVDLHTLANLHHRIAMLTEEKYESDRKAEEADGYYEKALTKYGALKKLTPLEILCKGDRLRVQYMLIADKKEEEYVFATFRDICVNSGKLSPLFESEFRTSFGKLMLEKGRFEGVRIQFNTAKKDMLEGGKFKMSHPLSAFISERRAWSLMDQWDVKDAADLFRDALKCRTENHSQNYGMEKNQQALIYAKNDDLGVAMSMRYQNQLVEAIIEFERIRKEIMDEIKKNTDNKKYLLDLNDRLGNTCERLADCTFYGGVTPDSNKKEEYLNAAVNYSDAAKYYGAAQQHSMIPVMKLKEAIMRMLCEVDEEVNTGKVNLNQAIEDAEKYNMSLFGNKTRYVLLRELAEAVLEMKSEKEPTNKLIQFATKLNPNTKRLYPDDENLKFFFIDKEGTTEETTEETKEEVMINWTELLRRENLEIYLFTFDLLKKNRDLDNNRELRDNLNQVMGAFLSRIPEGTTLSLLDKFQELTQ